MGLTIHYSGKLNKATELQLMIEEVRDIAIEKGWKYFAFEEKFENDCFTIQPETDKLFGIMVTPLGSEPLYFTFLSDGRMCGIIDFEMSTINPELNKDLRFRLFTKTQYAGFETHKQLIVLIDYISKKYLADFNCIDEGQYWETRDEDLLKHTFKRFEDLIEGFASSLDMIPPSDGETLEEHLIRLADTTNDRFQNPEKDLPSLSIEEENQFKRMKIELEHDGFLEKGNSEIPPEVEGQFLDYILEFEKQFIQARRIRIYEKVGKPIFFKSNDLSPEELEVELENLFQLLEQNNIVLDVLYDYENENKLIYDFITEELFNEEIDDISIPGMNTHFTYEEFHSNHTEVLTKDSREFWVNYFANDSEHFDEFTLGDLLNADEMIAFRNSFLTFSEIKITVLKVDFNLEKAKARTKVRLAFEAHIDKQDQAIFDCESVMDFKYQHGYWYLKEVDLPR